MQICHSSKVDESEFVMDNVLVSAFLKQFVEDWYKNFKMLFPEESQKLLLFYGFIIIITAFIVKSCFSQMSKTSLFHFGLLFASVLIGMGYVRYKSFDWLHLIPLTLLGLPLLSNNNTGREEDQGNSKRRKKGRLSFIAGADGFLHLDKFGESEFIRALDCQFRPKFLVKTFFWRHNVTFRNSEPNDLN